MNCPSCGIAVSPPPSAVSRTHDTSPSSYGIALPTWLNRLDRAVEAARSTEFARYSQVVVLMISWEETYAGAMKVEFCRLASVFRKVYGYSVTTWHIPSKKPTFASTAKILEFMREYGYPDNLIIVYYAGHARHNPKGGQFPIWQPKSKSEKGKEVNTAAFHSLLVTAEDDSPDVILLYDCHFALSSHTSSTSASRAEVEGLFAGWFGSQVPIPGQDSFTKHLIDALATAPVGQPLSIVELHRQIIVRQQSFHAQAIFDEDNKIRVSSSTGRPILTKAVRVTPSHLFLAGNENPRLLSLIPLGPVKTGDKDSTRDGEESDWPKVLISIRLIDDDDIESKLKKWLLTAPKGEEYRGLHPSFSNFLLMEVSVAIWDLLPSCPAISFESFTTKGSLGLQPRGGLRRSITPPIPGKPQNTIRVGRKARGSGLVLEGVGGHPERESSPSAESGYEETPSEDYMMT